MNIMIRRTPIRFFAALAALSLAFTAISLHAQDDKRGRKYKAPPPTSRIAVTVVRDTNGKPIENASVVFHQLTDTGKDDGNMELKTDEDGKTTIDVIETGSTLRVQVLARGFQTFGKDYKVDKSDMAFEVRMKRPAHEYSIYEQHPDHDQGEDRPQNQNQNQQQKPDSQQKPQQ